MKHKNFIALILVGVLVLTMIPITGGFADSTITDFFGIEASSNAAIPEDGSSNAAVPEENSSNPAISEDSSSNPADSDDIMNGDVDGDRVITSNDARLALRYAVGLEVLNEVEFIAADVDGDGKVSAADARYIIRSSVGLEVLGPYGFDIPTDIPVQSENNIKLSVTENEENVIVTVAVHNASNVSSFDILLNYDDEVLNFEKTEANNDLTMSCTNGKENGTVRFAGVVISTFIESIGSNQVEIFSIIFNKSNGIGVEKTTLDLFAKVYTNGQVYGFCAYNADIHLSVSEETTLEETTLEETTLEETTLEETTLEETDFSDKLEFDYVVREDKLYVKVYFNNLPDFWGGDFCIEYNSDLLTFSGCEEGSAIDSDVTFRCNGNETGKINIAFYHRKYFDNESLLICTLCFNVNPRTVRMFIKFYGNINSESYISKIISMEVSDGMIPMDGPCEHKYAESITTAATCATNGVKTFVCVKCEDTYTTAIPKLNHSSVTVKGYAATCTENGLSDGAVCSVCDAMLTGQTTIPSKGGHDYVFKESVESTCTAVGHKTYVCSECGSSRTDLLALSAHKWTQWTVRNAATTEREGTEVRICSVCKKEETRSIEKLPIVEITVNVTVDIKINSLTQDIFAATDVTVEELIKNSTENIVVVDKDGKEAKTTDKLATGMKIILADENGNIVDSKTVIVPGDVDCDGDIKASDARAALRAAVKLDKLEIYQQTAADISDASQELKITSADARSILRAAVGLESMKDWLTALN